MNKQTKNFTIAALVMGAVGYITGILTAPKSGKETRKDIKNTALKVKIELEKKLKDVYSELNDALEGARFKAAQSTGRLKEELNDAIKSAQETKDKIRQVLSALHEGSAEDAELNIAVLEAKDAVRRLKKYLGKDEER